MSTSVKKLYLSKSKVCDGYHASKVEQRLKALSRTYEFELVQFAGGGWSSKDETLIKESDMLFVVGPEEQPTSNESSANVGKGQHSTVDIFSDAHPLIAEAYYVMPYESGDDFGLKIIDGSDIIRNGNYTDSYAELTITGPENEDHEDDVYDLVDIVRGVFPVRQSEPPQVKTQLTYTDDYVTSYKNSLGITKQVFASLVHNDDVPMLAIALL
jgi:hypothetical protein